MKRDPTHIRNPILGKPKDSESSKKGTRRIKKLRIDELYAMYISHKPYSQLSSIDKEIAREELARKVLKYYFHNWSLGYLRLIKELEDFYEVFPRAGRDKVTFTRFIRSLSVVELKRVFNSEPELLHAAFIWLKRYQGKAKSSKKKKFGEVYAKVAQAVSELKRDKWAKKLVKTVLNILKDVEPIAEKGFGKKERSFYDYYALFIMKKTHVAASTALTAAILTTRHVVANYFFDPVVGVQTKARVN